MNRREFCLIVTVFIIFHFGITVFQTSASSPQPQPPPTPADAIVRFVAGLARFVFDSVREIPISISLMSAITLTFMWVFSEVTTVMRLFKSFAVGMWILVAASLLTVQIPGGLELVALTVIIVAINFSWAILKRRRRPKDVDRWGIEYVCRNCGNSQEFYGYAYYKEGKLIEVRPEKCNKCGSTAILAPPSH